MYSPLNEKISVLILDDNPDDIELMRYSLIKEFKLIDIVSVNNEIQFKEALENKKFNLILSDYNLPSYSGENAIHYLKSKGSDVPIIIISGTVGDEKAVELIKAGAIDFLLKSNLPRLPLKVQRALNEYRENQELQKAQKELLQKSLDLTERVKELTALINISNLLNQQQYNLFEVIDQLSKEVINGFKEPQNTCFRIQFDNFDHKSLNYRESVNTIKAPVLINNIEKGSISVGYLVKSENVEDVFLKEEYNLISSVGNLISNFLDRINYQQQLKESERKLKQAQSISNFGSYVIDLQNNKVEWSEELYKIYDIEPFSVEPSIDLFYNIIHPDDKERLAQSSIFKEIEEKGFISIEHKIFTQKSIEKIVHAESVLKKDSNGMPVEIIGTVQDITERKSAVEKLRKSEEFYRNILENSDDGITISDENGYIIFQSPSNENITGYQKGELLGKSVLTLIHPDDLEKSSKTLEKLLSTPNEYFNETVQFKSKSEGYKTIKVNCINLLHNPAVKGIVFNFSDISEKVQYQEYQKRLTTILESTSDLVSIADKNQNVIYLNEAGKNLLKIDSVDVLSNGGLFSYFTNESVKTVKEIAIPEAIEKGTWQGETILINSNGDKIPVSQVLVALKNENGELEYYSNIMRDITEIKKAEKAIIDSQHRFSQAFHSAPIPTSITKINDGTFLDINEAFEDFFGIKREEVIGKTSLELDIYHNPADRNKLFQALNHSGPIKRTEFVVNAANNEKKEVLLSLEKIDLENEACFLIMVMDITEQKRAAEKIKLSEKSYRDLFNNSLDLLYIHDLDGTIIDINDSVISKYGYSREEVIGKPPQFLGADEKNDYEMMAEKFFKAVDGEPQQLNWWAKKKNGELFPKEVMLSRGVYFDKQVVIASGRDITERIEAEAEIRKSEELLRQLFHNSPIGIVLMDEESKILNANKGFENIFNYNLDEIKYKNIDEVIAPDHLIFEAKGISKKVAEGNIVEKESYRIRKDGSMVPVLIYAVPLKVEQKFIGSYGIIVDISERKKAEIELQELTKELMRYNEDLQHFAYVTSHNLRAPVANLTGLLQLLNLNEISDPENEVIIDKIDKSVKNLDHTLYDLVEIISARKSVEDQIEDVKFQYVLNDVADNLNREILDSDTKIISDFSDVDSIRYSYAHLHSILLNLISNAIKYRSPLRSPEVIVKSQDLGNMVCLTISDNGIGINLEKHKQKLFKMYQRLMNGNNKVEGKGLGLYIVKMQVESLGGTIDIESTVDEGTTFKIFLKKNLKKTLL